MWKDTIWPWLKANPQKTTGMIQVASGSILASLPTFQLPPVALSVILALFGLLQAVFGFLHKDAAK